MPADSLGKRIVRIADFFVGPDSSCSALERRYHIELQRTVILLVALAQLDLSFAQGRRGPVIVSPEIASDHRVTFRLRAPEAREVSVSGLPTPLLMVKDEQGVWSATTANPLDPEMYVYGFNVDGVRMPDPANMTSSSVGIMGASSCLRIPGQPWTDTTAPHGAVSKHVYQSTIIGGTEVYYVYTPPNYDSKRKTPYPVLVVLHGLSSRKGLA